MSIIAKLSTISEEDVKVPVMRLQRHRSITRKSEHPRAKAIIPLSVTCSQQPKFNDWSALQCFAKAYTNPENTVEL